MKHIIKKIIQKETVDEYRVRKNETLTLVYFVENSTDTEINTSVRLIGEGAKATIIGIVQGSGNATIKISTLQHHEAPNTTSNLLVKCVLRDVSTCHYTGSIVVDTVAQKTDAYQRNENLLLDEGAKATSSPVLEILANDVRCTHGAIVKTLERNELWYLASRGIDPTMARGMIAAGFLKSALWLIPELSEKIFPS